MFDFSETIGASTSPGTLSRNIRGLPDITGPLVLTISSRIWNAFNTSEVFLNDTMNSTLSTNISGAVGTVKYKLWNASLESLSFSTKNVSFRKFRHGGLRIRIRGLKFTASADLELEVDFWLARLKFSGKVWVMSENIRVDIAFIWNNFTIASKIRMGSNIRLFFTGSLQYFNLVEPMLRNIIRKNIEEQIRKAVENEVNPYLQELKKMVRNAGLSFLFKLPIKWALHNGTLQIVLNSKRRKQDIVELSRQEFIVLERYFSNRYGPLRPSQPVTFVGKDLAAA
ncbi:unnamed protein product [Cylicocyclus nassatus]|uniref:Uncharacterized protein n=1 Tax=Cylicocyclus nassatus TaxID=53992 RepID=A0AA36GEJ6_CYLNA|nr:unnamed protein product [Cylicocyclus nassatus]